MVTSGFTTANSNALWVMDRTTLEPILLVSRFSEPTVTYLDIAHTENRLWLGGTNSSNKILEYELTLDPFSIVYRRDLNLPNTGYRITEGLAVRQSGGNTFLIATTGATASTNQPQITCGVVEFQITGDSSDTLTAIPKFQFETSGACVGDMIYTTDDKLIVNLRINTTSTTQIWRIYQYNYTTGLPETGFTPSNGSFLTRNSFFTLNSNLYILRSGNTSASPSNTAPISINSPYTMSAISSTFWTGFSVFGASQVPSASTISFIVT
jgi:hypothetical protein